MLKKILRDLMLVAAVSLAAVTIAATINFVISSLESDPVDKPLRTDDEWEKLYGPQKSEKEKQ